MEFFFIIWAFVHAALGYGLMRLFKRVPHCKLARDCEDNFSVILIWPILLIMIAFDQTNLKEDTFY